MLLVNTPKTRAMWSTRSLHIADLTQSLSKDVYMDLARVCHLSCNLLSPISMSYQHQIPLWRTWILYYSPPPPPPVSYLIQSHLRGRLNRDGGLGGLLNLAKMIELDSKVEKLKYEKVGGHAAEDQNQIRISSWK